MLSRSAALAAAALVAGVMATDDFCASVTSCLKDGSETCNTTSGDCPPCIYTLADGYSCWEKDNSTNTCPFTGVRYDCTNAWSSDGSTSSSTDAATAGSSSIGADSSSSNSSSTATEASGSGAGVATSSLITYIAIGGAVLLVLVIGCVVWRRKRQSARARRDLHTPPHSGKRDRGMSKRDEALAGPYNNIPDTSKSGGGYAGAAYYGNQRGTNAKRSGNRSRKQSDAVVIMEAGRESHGQSFVSIVPTEDSNSFEGGILGDRSPSILGDDRSQRSGKSRNSRGGPRGGGNGVVVGGIGGFATVNEKLVVQQDVANRCTTSANMYDEYMRMKEEMQYDREDDAMSATSDAISDFESDTMSLSKFSLESSTGMQLQRHHDNGLSLTDSVTDSEYAAAMRDRGESDCFSEMSYNDEKYSFSESDFDMTSLDGSHARGASTAAATNTKPDREVEI